MDYRDLQKLRHRIHTVGTNVRQQENFYGDINEFLHQVYHADKNEKRRHPGLPKLAQALTDYR